MSGVIPKYENGKIDWLAYLRTTWPIIFCLGTALIYVSGRLQTVDQKRDQNDIWERPWRQRIERNERDIQRDSVADSIHSNLDGHPVMRAEYRVLLNRLERVEKQCGLHGNP